MLSSLRGNRPASYLSTSSENESETESDQKPLKKAYAYVKHAIDNDLPPDLKLGRLDFQAMPHLVEWANAEYAGIGLHYASTPYDLAEKLADITKRGETSARFIGNLSPREMHMCAFDYKLIKGIPSLIGLEPGNKSKGGPAMMAFRMNLALQEHLPEAKFAMLEVNQQSSEYDCGMFSLDYAVKMHKSTMPFERLHAQNCNDTLQDKDDSNTVPYTAVDKLLPPIFMKHIQGNRRLAELHEARPELESEPVNKRSETLTQRVERHGMPREVAGEVKVQNESIAHQREKYVRKALGL